MQVSFKTEIWEDIQIPERLQKKVKELIEKGEITNSVELLELYPELISEQDYTTQEQMLPVENDNQDTIIISKGKEKLWGNGKPLDAPTESISIVWCADDVIGHGKDQEVYINEQDAGKILDNMKRKHDAYCGISWDTIDYYVDENGHSKVELEESSFMELVSELADALLREKYNGVIDVECGIEIRYSEKAQDIFNEYYDLFETILNEMGIQKSSNNTSVELIPKARYEDLLKSLVCEVFEGCLDEEEKLKEVIVKVLDTYTEEKTDA